MDWTTTTLDAGIPGLVDIYDYDVPLTTMFRNRGAPRFIFNKSEMKVLFTIEVLFFLEKDSGQEPICTVVLNDILLDFDMKIENMWLNIEW